MSWKPRVIDGEGGRAGGPGGAPRRPEPSDADLVHLAIHGLGVDGRPEGKAPGGEAFALLVDRYERSVLRVSWNMTGNREDARDAAQDAFLRAYRSLRSFRPEGSFRSWLLKIAVNAARDVVGHRPSALRVVEAPEARDPGNLEATAEAALMLDVVRRAMTTLPEREREVMALRDFEDMDIEEIATMLGIAVPTVRRHLARARLHVRRLIAATVATEGPGADER